MMHAYISNEYKSFTMFALDLKRGMFSSHLKKKIRVVIICNVQVQQ